MQITIKTIRPFVNNYCTTTRSASPKALYKYLIRQCEKLPKGPKEHYQFMVKQSFKQHMNETDSQRIAEIISRSYEDADWILSKYLSKEKL